MNNKIFINYRQDDSPWNSLALYQELLKHFSKDTIFKDFNTITPGADFVESIENALETCDVLLVLIDENWMTIEDKKGNRRIKDPNDFVRLEIAVALKRNIPVIPILFENAKLPLADELPEDLKNLAQRQSIEIGKTRFESDVKRLVEAIRKSLSNGNNREKKGTLKRYMLLSAGIIVVLFGFWETLQLTLHDKRDNGDILPIKRDSSRVFLKIGDKYHGGIIFDIDSIGQHGLIAAENDLGVYNWEDAKKICIALGGGWHLPTKYELNKLYQKRKEVGGLVTTLDTLDILGTLPYYWSSTEELNDPVAKKLNTAWLQSFQGGVQAFSYKYNTARVRAVRTF